MYDGSEAAYSTDFRKSPEISSSHTRIEVRHRQGSDLGGSISIDKRQSRHERCRCDEVIELRPGLKTPVDDWPA
jgi:hypothetical protein